MYENIADNYKLITENIQKAKEKQDEVKRMCA
jgi:hypothetical protein